MSFMKFLLESTERQAAIEAIQETIDAEENIDVLMKLQKLLSEVQKANPDAMHLLEELQEMGIVVEPIKQLIVKFFDSIGIEVK